MRWMILSISLCSAFVAGCSTLNTKARVPESACNVPGAALWTRTELYFGMQKPDDSFTSDEEYQQFLDEQVTPQFRDGFTLLTGRGQYLDPNGRLWREPNKVLIITYPPDVSRNAAIEAIRSSYKKTFQQQSVMRVDGTQCVSF